MVFDELEKSKSHLLIEQMHRNFEQTAVGRHRASRTIPEPFFVHSDLTTGVQVADLLAYVISRGFRMTAMTKLVREELSPFAFRLSPIGLPICATGPCASAITTRDSRSGGLRASLTCGRRPNGKTGREETRKAMKRRSAPKPPQPILIACPKYFKSLYFQSVARHEPEGGHQATLRMTSHKALQTCCQRRCDSNRVAQLEADASRNGFRTITVPYMRSCSKSSLSSSGIPWTSA